MATSCRLIHSDLSGEATPYETGSPTTTWLTALTNLQSPLLSAVARTTMLVGAAFGMRFASEVTVSAAAIIASNLSTTATYRLTAYTGSPSSQVFTTGTQNAWNSSKQFIDPDEKGLNIPILFGQNVTADDFVLELNDPSNTDGFIELSKLMLGSLLVPTFNFWDGADFMRDPNTQVETSIGGTRFYNRHKNIRRWTLAFPQETYANAWDEFDELVELHGLDRSVFVIAYPDDLDRMHQHSFFGTLEKTSALRQLVHGNVSTGLDVIETV